APGVKRAVSAYGQSRQKKTKAKKAFRFSEAKAITNSIYIEQSVLTAIGFTPVLWVVAVIFGMVNFG
ncbi:hypothetical protein KIPB_016743, partial [Kipferlia bialata]